jgi:hypothetical protein
VEAQEEFAQLQLRFVDQMQWHYELIRPLVLFPTGPATQRAQETGTHPDTIRTLKRRFQRQGLPGLLPGFSQEGRQRPGPARPASRCAGVGAAQSPGLWVSLPRTGPHHLGDVWVPDCRQDREKTLGAEPACGARRTRAWGVSQLS